MSWGLLAITDVDQSWLVEISLKLGVYNDI